MAILPHSLIGLRVDHYVDSAVRYVQGLVGIQQFSPEETLSEAKNVDPRLVPKTPMQSGDIDMNLLVELSKMGMRRGKLVSEASHPELMESWKIMSERAGLKKAPQLIIVESSIVNAMTVTDEEVVVTTGLLKKLDFREVNAVLGHELAHANSDHKRPRIAASAIFSLLGGLAANAIWHRSDKAAEVASGANSALASVGYDLLTFSVGSSAGSIAANHISVKPTELQADLKGAAISGDPLGLVSALRKLEQDGQRKRPIANLLSGLFSGYPTMEQRIDNLQTIAASMPPVVLAPCINLEAAQVNCTKKQAPTAKVSSIAAEERMETATPTHAVG